MFNSYPKISIVTSSFNQGQYLDQTIESVLSQKYPNLEYIIIDGGSTDNSVEIIKKYEHHLTYWVSEKDKGQANAINKGLKLCTGEIFNWLNSDDYLEPGALHKIAMAFCEKNVSLVAGKVRNFSSKEEEYIQNQNLSAQGLMCWEPNVQFVQPGVWLRRELIEACGGIDEQFHYAFDWDLYIRYLYHFPKVKEINDHLVHFRIHDNSKTKSALSRFAEEEGRIIEKLYNLNEYEGLKDACLYKIQKANWTNLLSELSKSDLSFVSKLVVVIKTMREHSKVSLSRQTLGALKAFMLERTI
ncbi:MAG: glycosyltransferase [Bacteroidetes bacterium]|nr:glycosyltransferase [Bacteroidota bacterium]